MLIIGCSSAKSSLTTDDPLADLRNKQCTPEERLEAVDRAWGEALAGTLEIGAVREQFKTSLFLESSTDAVRYRIVKKLLSDEREQGIADTRNVLRLRVQRESSWPIINLVCDEAVKRNWTDLTPALVRSYSRKVNDPPDDQRPERHALLALNPGKTIEEIVYDVFVSHKSAPGASDAMRMLDERARTDAWDLLGRLDADGSKRAALLASDSRITQDVGTPVPGGPSAASGARPAPDSMLTDLRAAAKDLRSVPITGAELEWVRSLRSPGNTLNESWWKQTTSAIAGLTPEQALGMEVRHGEAVRWASAHRPEWLGMNVAQLRGELEARLKGVMWHERSAEDGDFGTAVPETIEYWEKKLVWGDYLTVLVITEALRDPGVIASLLKQSEEDRANTKTELGGALEAVTTIGEGAGLAASPVAPSGSASHDRTAQFEARAYPPQVGTRSSDNKYVASERMIASTPRSLAHYHFHAQKEKNTDYAGPSKGDLEYAKNNARNCLVLTSVGRNTLGVDYYQRNGARLDLGEIKIGK